MSNDGIVREYVYKTTLSKLYSFSPTWVKEIGGPSIETTIGSGRRQRDVKLYYRPRVERYALERREQYEQMVSMGLSRLKEERAAAIGPTLDRAERSVIKAESDKVTFHWLGLLDLAANRHLGIWKRQRNIKDILPDAWDFDPDPDYIREYVRIHQTTYIQLLDSFWSKPAAGLCFLIVRDMADQFVDEYLDTHFRHEWADFVAAHDDGEEDAPDPSDRRTLTLNIG